MGSPTERARTAKGFALYVGVDEQMASQAGVSLVEIVQGLKNQLGQWVPEASTHATIALAPRGARGDNLELVRLALHDPGTLSVLAERQQDESASDGVVIDISRKRLAIAGQAVGLTFGEFELLQFLVLREGQAVSRQAIIDHLWSASSGESPNSRTIDVYVRRLRAKLEPYPDLVRTVRGEGYRFDRHADVTIVYGQGPSPDIAV